MTGALFLKALLGVVLIVSVSSKWMANSTDDPVDHLDIQHHVGSFLTRHGFALTESEHQVDFSLLPAEKGSCELLVAEASPIGWYRHVIRSLAGPGDEVFFVFRGEIYSEQPKWLTWAHYYWRMINGYIGRMLPVTPVFGVITSLACDVKTLPWSEIAEVPAG